MVNQQFAVAVHIMTALAYHQGGDVPSRELARSLNANPSFVRRILAKLSKAGLIQTTTGKHGSCRLGKAPRTISLLDIYRLVEAPKAFALHHYPIQTQCEVSCAMASSMKKILGKTQSAMAATLKGVTLADIVSDIRRPSRSRV